MTARAARASARRSIPAWVSALGLVIALLLLGQVGVSNTRWTAPVVQHADTPTSSIQGRAWRVRVRDARLTREIRVDDRTYTTAGRWLVVTVDERATSRTALAPTFGARESHGITWWQTSRTLPADHTLHSIMLPPGITARGVHVIELAPDARPTELRVLSTPSTQLDSELDIPLHITSRPDRIELPALRWHA